MAIDSFFLTFLISLISICITACTSKISPETKTPIERQLVAPGVLSLPDRHEFGSTFTPDGSEVFIGIEHGNWASIVSYKRNGEEWHGPNEVIGNPELSANDPMFSPDGKHLYFIAKRSGQYDIGYLERAEKGKWSPPNWISGPINSRANEYYISFTESGDLVFASNRDAETGNDFDILRARKAQNGDYSLEAFPNTINTKAYEADAFIDPSERYLIFSSNRPEGLGHGDLYISFAEDNGTWTRAVSLGNSVNTSGHELCPYVSHDGKWLYFTSSGDIYRISTDIFTSAKTAYESETLMTPSERKREFSKNYVSVDAKSVLLKNATVHIGGGRKAEPNYSILIKGKFIEQIGPNGTVSAPSDAVIIDVDGASVMPGIIGMHNHTHMPGRPLLKHMAPRLYLAGGVTTITTAGSADPLGELELAKSIRMGLTPGPTIFPSAHYITGPNGNGVMTKPVSEEAARVFVRTWAKRGVSWFKLYRHTEPHIAAALIEEANSLGLKVTGHLCSITYQEAAAMGIDSLEHGLNPVTDFVTDKPKGKCVPSRASKLTLDEDSPKLRALIKTLIDSDVTLTSTLAILETSFPHRPQADDRSLALMSKPARKAYDRRQTLLSESTGRTSSTASYWSLLLAFEREFVKAGGRLVAGPDTGRHIFPGYGDQRNFELLVEAGFSIDETIEIMSTNGAEVLGISDKTGLIAAGLEADLLVLNGSLLENAANIRTVKIVFKDGIGFDPNSLVESVQNHVRSKQ